MSDGARQQSDCIFYLPRIIIMGVCVKIFVMLGSSVYNLINSVLVFSDERAR